MTPLATARSIMELTDPLGSQVADTLSRGLEESSIAVVWFPAPLVALDCVFAQAPSANRLAWHEAEGEGWVGWGRAMALRAEGECRFAEAKRRLAQVFDSPRVTAIGGASEIPPRFFGGFAFRSGGARGHAWESFGDAYFVLPQFVYYRDGERAQFGLAAARGQEPSALVRTLLEARRSLRAVAPPLAPSPRVVTQRGPDTELSNRIESAIAAIGRGEFDKVVVADHQHLELDPAPDASVVLRHLMEGSPTATAFAFDTESSCFLGASPERLVLRSGLEVLSEALAGSIQLTPGSNAAALLGSDKDQHEHAFVVRAIEAALSPHCTELRASPRPVLRRLRHVAHLSTPISGRLAHDVHVFDLVALLHPTPAVGGHPTRAAVQWLAEHEPVPRGWYAGPVGWVDSRGDGDFFVALRSGTLSDERAELFAGAGIVRDSNPCAEVAEIQVKLATFRNALGVPSP